MAQLDPDQIYNPLAKVEPKTKPIFKVVKPSSRKSSISGGSGDSCHDPRFLADIERQADQMNLFSSMDCKLGYGLLKSPNIASESCNLGLPGFTVPMGYTLPSSSQSLNPIADNFIGGVAVNREEAHQRSNEENE